MKTKALLSSVLLLSGLAFADTIELRDGTRIEGTAKFVDSGWIITLTGGGVRRVGPDDIRKIVIPERKGADDFARREIAELRKWAATTESPAEAAKRFQRLLAAYPGVPATQEAIRDLVTWRDRADRDCVLLGGEWVPRAVAAQRTAQVREFLDQALAIVAKGSVAPAEPSLDAVLKLDGLQPQALYLKALALMERDKNSEAREKLEQLVKVLPDHAASLNNLGVAWQRLKYPTQGLTILDKAMSAAPRDQTILDNVAELLNLVPAETKKTDMFKRVARRFEEQDTALAAQLIRKGLTRHGAIWLTDDEVARVKKAKQEVEEKAAKIREDQRGLSARADRLSAMIRANERDMDRIERDRRILGSDGRIYYLAMPTRYYDIKRENRGFEADRADIAQQIQALDTIILSLRPDATIPAFTGVLHLAGPESMPPLPVQLPTSQPK